MEKVASHDAYKRGSAITFVLAFSGTMVLSEAGPHGRPRRIRERGGPETTGHPRCTRRTRRCLRQCERPPAARKPACLVYVDVVLLGVLFLFGTFGGAEYLGTRRDGHSSWGFYGLLAFMGLGLLLFIGPWILALRLFIAWPRHIRGFRRLLLRQVVVIVGVMSLLAATSTRVLAARIPVPAVGFRRYVQRQADIPAMQTWLDTVDPNVHIHIIP